MRNVFDNLLILIFAISGYVGSIYSDSYGIFRNKPMTKSGCLFDGRVVLDGKSIAIPGSCQTLTCYGNQFQKSNKDCASITSGTFKCLPGISNTDQNSCIKSTCFVDHQGYSMKHTRGCKINGNCVFPSDFKDAFGLRFLCHHMRCTRKGFVRSQKKSLCSRDDLCRSTRWIDAYKCMD